MITATLGGVALPDLEVPFIESPIEHATDVETLDGSLFTQFSGQHRQWELSWESLTEAEYDAIRAVYDTQFSTNTYPTLAVPHYSISVPVRMKINDKDIWNNCGEVQNVKLTLREA